MCMYGGQNLITFYRHYDYSYFFFFEFQQIFCHLFSAAYYWLTQYIFNYRDNILVCLVSSVDTDTVITQIIFHNLGIR